eukprot:COSAG02_NODE_9724_length_2132_cov_1.307919_1_plen_420_part_00
MSGTAARSGYASVRSNDQESDSDSSDEERTHCAQQLAEGKIGDGDSYAGDVGGVYLPGHSRRSQSTYLACCCGINVGVYFLYHAVPSTATLLRREFAFSAVQIGTLQSMYSLPTLGVVFCSGIVVDRIGLWSSCLIFASVVLVASIIWCTALTVLSSSSTIFAFGICAQGFLGTGGESLFVAQKALLGATFGAHGDNDSTEAVGCQVKTGFAFGASQTAAKLAQAAALWIMPPVATKFGLIAAFTFASGVCFLALVCCACGFSMERTRLSTGPKTSAAATSSSGVSTSRLVPHDDDQCENGKDAGRGKCSELPHAFWMLICCIACGSLVSSSMDALYTDALVERFGYSIEFAGRVSSMQFALSAAGAPIVGAYLDRRGKLCARPFGTNISPSRSLPHPSSAPCVFLKNQATELRLRVCV